MMKNSIIALVDCDSFFVSCEQSVDKSLKGKPVCVLSNNDACVVARSKEAKKMGVRMGMPYFMAKKEFPNAIYCSGRIELYRKISKQVMAILKDVSPDVQVYSVDEAFVELSGVRKLYKLNYYKLAKKIRDRIKLELDINVSVGVSRSKVLAKLACENAKKLDGIYLIGQCKIEKELKNTKVGEIWGIGRSTANLFNRWGILTCDELVKRNDDWLKIKVGVRGIELKHELLGEIVDSVKSAKKMPKSIQNTRSFPNFSTDKNYIKNWLNRHIHTSCTKLRHLNGRCKTVCLMLKTKNFMTYFEKINLKNETDFEIVIAKEVFKLLDKIYIPNTIYRSCGVTLENLNFEPESQLTLFSDNENNKDFTKLATALDKLEKKFGKNVVKTGFTDTGEDIKG